MKQKFAEWARRFDLPVGEDWSVEQICDAIIEKGVEWPPDLVNEEGWQLWTAVLRRECQVQAIAWDELTGEGDKSPALEVTFRLQDRREFKTRIARQMLKSHDFGACCRVLEDRLREWKVKDDADREEALRKADKEWAERAPDLFEYVIGFRSWNLSGHRLKPIGAGNDVWKGGEEARATCGRGEVHRAPDPNCECGLYAWNDWDKIKGECGPNDGKVYGAVVACGRMEIHKSGFRAEFMRPVVLGYDDSQDRMEGMPEVLGELGKTAQRAGVTANPARIVRGPDYERVRRIADELGVEAVVPFNEVPMKAKEFGEFLSDNPRLLPD